MSCYEQFGWTPADIKAIPWSEAQLLSVYFEELALKAAEDRKEAERQARNNNSSGGAGEWVNDDTFGDDPDEIDYHEALKRGLITE